MTDYRGTDTKASRVERDGLFQKFPGLQGANYKGDAELFKLSSRVINLHTSATTTADEYIMPVDWVPIAAYMNLLVAPGTAAATIGIGISTNTDAILDDYSIGTADATGFLNLTTNAAFTGAELVAGGSQGDVITFQTNGNATATGKAVWGCLIIPK